MEIDLLIIHIHLGSSQSLALGSLKIKTVTSLIRETWDTTPTSLLKKNLTYSSIFKVHFMQSFATAKASLFLLKVDAVKQPFANVLQNRCC